jgi:hypothetical protein
VIDWLQNLWWRRQRAIDLLTLWPACKNNCSNLDEAHTVFMVHAVNDPAWVRFYGENLWKAVEELR